MHNQTSWIKTKISAIADLKIGLIYKPENVSNKGIFVIRSSNIQNGSFIRRDDDVYVDVKLTKNLDVKKDDIIMCARNGSKALIGKSAIIRNDLNDTTFGAFMLRIRSDKNRYLYQYFQSNAFFKYLNKDMGATINQVTSGYLGNLEIYIPPIHEFIRITEILSTWDEAIDLESKLIIQKSGFLSNLALSLQKNQRSLVNFESSWETITLSSVFRERKEFGYEDDGLELYSLTIEDGVTAKTDRYNREFLVKGDKKKYKVSRYHDLVFNPQNLRYGSISLNYTEKPVLLSPIYATLEIKDNERFDIEYFNFLLTSNEMIKFYDSIAEGTLVERMTVKPEIFLKQEFSIPPIEEQRKISQVLIGLREEINLLKKELELKKLQKQGLMQQLLTGKIRVNVN